MSVPETVTQESLNKFVHDAKAKMAAVDTHAERIAAIDVLSKQLRAELDVQRAEIASRPTLDSEVSVERAYVLDSRSKQEARVARLGEPLSVDDGRVHVGNSAGVIRLLSSHRGSRCDYGLLDDPAPKSEWQRELQQRVDEVHWVQACGRQPSARLLQSVQRHVAQGPQAVTKILADNAGEGGEWIPTIPSSMLARYVETPRTIEGQIPTLDVMSNNTTHPFLSKTVQPYVHNAPASGDLVVADLPLSVPTSAERTITVRTLTANVAIDHDAEEDAIIAMIPLLQSEVSMALTAAFEDALINGDTAAAHGDTAFATWNPRGMWSVLGTSQDHRRIQIGWRHRAIDVSSTVDQNASQTVAAILGAKSRMGQYGLGRPERVPLLVSPEFYLARLLVDGNVLTVDKMGPQATIYSGMLGSIGGSPVVASDFLTPDLAATGLYTGSGALTGALWVNLDRFYVARRRGQRVSVSPLTHKHVTYVTASERKTLHTVDGASDKNVLWMYNLATTPA